MEYSRVEQQELNASQRTFEGAYLRTALSKFSFGMLVLRVFTAEFLAIGVVYTFSALCTVVMALYCRNVREGHLAANPSTTFHTGSSIVALTAILDILTMITMLILVARL
ncbi:hypothetical protein DASB73_013060 [Starmerella bacillaris]|uniref:DUF202 domain-containing protein n=1 Tax=Starmerella bacillaris TaxID=1247836 RepID=A0AAV5RGU7_STABA|nr:hypothetical protein DASB73_013060 [Starmerella bacillaris]